MIDEININLRALTERQRNNILKVLKQSIHEIPDEINFEALDILQEFDGNEFNDNKFYSKNSNIKLLEFFKVSDNSNLKHGEEYLTYTPQTEITDEQYRLITYGAQKSGFPDGVTLYASLPKSFNL